MMATSFANSIAALAEYDAGFAARDAAWSAVQTEEDVAKCQEADTAAQEAVLRAFHKDTAAYNSLENCLRLAVADVRRTVGSLPRN